MKWTDFSPMDQAPMTPDALAALERVRFSRRDFLKGMGALMVGFSTAGEAQKLHAQTAPAAPRVTAPEQVDSWIGIAQDNSVTAYTGKCDFGQGFRTVQQQLI